MSTTRLTSAEDKPVATSHGRAYYGGIERRRRKRAKISAQLHIRGINSSEPLEEICETVDVSRDGLLFNTTRAAYWKGQRLHVTFPYSSAATALSQAQQAEIVRVTEQPGASFAIAVQFLNAKIEAKQERKGATTDALAGSETPSVHAQEKQQSVVLVVESDPRMAETMRTILQQDGYTVIIAQTAHAALDTLKTTVPAVFIAEVEAEDMSGQDLCLIIKRDERLQRVPVILMTRSAQPADYSASHQLGAVVCMAKPFKPERLVHVVRLVAPPPSLKNVYGSRVSNGVIERAL
jgi:CheY-like chemotaxis protein